jgi:hypothetical protein
LERLFKTTSDGGHILTNWNKLEQQGVCNSVALPFTLKSICRQETNYGKSKNAKIFPHAKI